MKKQSPLIHTLFRTILCFAVFHLAYLAIMAIVQGDWSLISLVSILDFGMISPGIESSVPAFFGGLVLMGVVYAVCLFTVKRDSSCW